MKLASHKSQGLASYGLWQEAAIIGLPALFAAQGRAAAPATALDLVERRPAALAEVEVEGIGILANPVVADACPPAGGAYSGPAPAACRARSYRQRAA